VDQPVLAGGASGVLRTKAAGGVAKIADRLFRDILPGEAPESPWSPSIQIDTDNALRSPILSDHLVQKPATFRGPALTRTDSQQPW